MVPLIADYIVVGGGLTGCAIASRLSRNASKASVILIEAGPDPTGKPNTDTILGGMSLLESELDHAYKSEPVAHTADRTHILNAGKVLGGGSVLNFGGWLPADAADYDQWGALVGDQKWSYEGLKPFLEKARSVFNAQSSSSDPERSYPLRGPIKDAWTELGVKPVERGTGAISGLVEFEENSRDGVRQPSHHAYPLDGVTVLTDATVHRILFTEKEATGVILVDGREIAARKEIVLCAGAYRTPQLLMLSGIGPSETLTEHGIPVIHPSPGVGEGLSDHFAVYLAYRLKDPSKGLALGSPLWTNQSFFKGLPGDWVVNEPLPQSVFEKFPADSAFHKRNLYEIFTAYVPPGIPGIPVDGSHIATSTMLLLPTSRGSVSLRSASPQDPPLIKPNYLDTALDREVLLHATRRTLNLIFGTEALKDIIESETPPSGEGLNVLVPLTPYASDDALRERIQRTGMQHHHSAGTAAMGRVVDVEGKVHGVKKLRVADASVIPIPLGGHPQATLYAMAEQLATVMLRDI